jgi:glycosyltransferase involved in cell wall biosynthesis
MSTATGVNLAGHLSAPQGLGVAARNTARLFQELGLEWVGIDVPPPAATGERVDWPAAHAWHTRARAPHAVNLLHLNPPEVVELLSGLPSWLDLGRVTACVPFWEFPKLPPAWLEGLECMDAVLAPSRFIERAVRDALPELPVFHFPQAVWLEGDVRPDRARFGIPERACVFMTAFDTRSDPLRKNPAGALAAFARAFPRARTDVRFVVRIQNARGPVACRGRRPHGVPLADEEALRDHASADPRVLLVDGPMGHADVLSLVASCDAYVSLHRAEGLGLPPLEAMSLGRPVVATAWSGNLDYMTADDSLLVPATEEFVRHTTIRAYDPSRMGIQKWGEPDLDVAAAHLRALADDAGFRTQLGARAKRAAERQRQASLTGTSLAQLAELAARRAAGAPVPPACAAARARVARQAPARRVRRRIVDALRAVGLGPRV